MTMCNDKSLRVTQFLELTWRLWKYFGDDDKDMPYNENIKYSIASKNE